MISQTAEYALRAVVDLAFHAGAMRTTRAISLATHVPSDYLAKVLKDLSREGIVRARRGPGGGFTLARSDEAISVYDVLQAVDPVKRIRHCPLGLKAHAHALCPLHQRLDEAMAHSEEIFRTTTIADVTAQPGGEKQSLSRRAASHISGGLMAINTKGIARSKSKKHLIAPPPPPLRSKAP